MSPSAAPTWVFTKGRERLQVRRTDATTLDIEQGNAAETLHFDSPAALVEFQAGLERRLLDSGWRFANFTPERRHESRRTRRERRTEVLQFPETQKTEAADS